MIATIDTRESLARARDAYNAALTRERTRILVCAGTGCIASGSLQLYDNLVDVVNRTGALVAISLSGLSA